MPMLSTRMLIWVGWGAVYLALLLGWRSGFHVWSQINDFHYGTYIMANYSAIGADFGDPRFRAVLDRIANLYSYLYCPDAVAYPWGSRTAQAAGLGRHAYRGQPGPDFTVSVHDANEWFAARRPLYYVLTYHGRLVPDALNDHFGSRMGYGGGTICQFAVPGRGTVLASVLNNSYGRDMQVHRWREFRLHGIVGTLEDGRPFVAADSEHLNARLDGTAVAGHGQVRERPLHAWRSYAFEADRILCQAMMGATQIDYRTRQQDAALSEAWEMIPYVSPARGPAARVSAVPEGGGEAAELTAEPVVAGRVTIDRGGYGVHIELDRPRAVRLGDNQTVLIRLIDKTSPPWEAGLEYALIPFADEEAAAAAAPAEP